MVDHVSPRAWLVVDDPTELQAATSRGLIIGLHSLAGAGWEPRLVHFSGHLEAGAGVHAIRLEGESAGACPDSRAAADAVDALAQRRGRPDIILAVEGSLAAETVARLSARWQVRLIARIESFRFESDGIEVSRLGLAGRHGWSLHHPINEPLAGTLVSTFAVQGLEAVADPSPDVREALTVGPVVRDTGQGEVMEVLATASLLEEARVVVAAGAGFTDRERLDWLARLADQLGGAVGCTRPLADRGWMPFACQIGTTGRTVSPDLYLAIGISGAAQHLASVRDARRIVAINIDRAAPIMAAADLAVVADLNDFVPQLIAKLAASFP